MGRITDSVATFNSLIRTFLAMVVVGGASYVGWIAYGAYRAEELELRKTEEELASAQSRLDALEGTLSEKDNLLSEKDSAIEQLQSGLQEKESQLSQQATEIAQLNVDIEAGRLRIDQLETSLHLLKVDHRLAQVTVLDQTTDDETGTTVSEIEFLEINDEGAAIGQPRTFQIEGDLLYVDHWVVKFDESYVERSDVHRSTSICLFRRLFGEFQEPSDGFELDEVGSRPHAYARGGKPSEFEESIWNDFWNIANDPAKAREMGIRAAHGEAVAIRLRKGMTYRVMLRASDGLSITPVDDAPDPSKPASPA